MSRKKVKKIKVKPKKIFKNEEAKKNAIKKYKLLKIALSKRFVLKKAPKEYKKIKLKKKRKQKPLKILKYNTPYVNNLIEIQELTYIRILLCVLKKI